MTRRQTKGDIAWNAFNYTALALLGLVCTYPLLWVTSVSFSHPEEVLRGSIYLFPKRFDIMTYKLVFSFEQLWVGYGNTIYYVVLGTIVNVGMTMLMAYPLSRTWLRGRSIVSWFIVFTMLFSGGMIPTFLVVKAMGLVNTRGAMIIPGAIGAWNLIMARTYLTANIPDELIDAAAIDGASDLRTFWTVVLPLSGPIIAVITLFYAVGHWNAYFPALLYLTKPKLFPVQVVLRDLTSGNLMRGGFGLGSAFLTSKIRASYTHNIKYAVIVVATVPILCIYPFLQKYFVKGVMLGALKG